MPLSPSLKRLVYLGPIIGFGIGGYLAVLFPYFKGKGEDVYGFVPYFGCVILIISLVGLVSAFLLHVNRPIGGLFLALAGILSCLLVVSIPAGLLEIIAVVWWIIINVANIRKINSSNVYQR